MFAIARSERVAERAVPERPASSRRVAPNSNDREFRRDEETVEEDKRQHQDEAQGYG